MKKTCKRSLALVLSLLMLLSVAPLSFALEGKCENCNAQVTFENKAAIPATCSSKGREAGLCCPECGSYAFGGEEIAMLDHTPKADKVKYSFNEANEKIAFDCTLGGYSYSVCSVCNAEYDETEIPVAEHEEYGVEAVPATCTQDGMTAYDRCKNCDVEYVGEAPQVIPAGHKLVKEDAVVADCTKTGHPDYWECSVCKKVFVLPEEFEVTEATTDEEIKAALVEVEPDYAEDGETVVKTAIAKITVPVQPHTFSATPTTPRDDITCDKGGSLATYTCPVCKKAYIEYDVEKGDKVPNDAFLNVEGLPTYEKDKSGSVYYKYMAKWTDAEVAKRDHVWVQDIGPNSLGYVKPKCNAKGSCLATCAICHKQTTLELDELPHTPKDNYETHRATCERGVYRSNTCSVCGQYYEIDLYDPKDSATDAYAPLGHAYSKTKTLIKESTCTEKGYYGYACEFCGKAEPGKIDYINELAPHKFSEEVKKVDATCTAEGMNAHYRCTVCNKYFNTSKKEVTKESLVIPKLNHVDKNKDAYCDNCGVIMNGCDHICHKQDVFSKLVWFIARLWYQYLGINQECKCGLPHYEKAKNPLN